ncbi:MAG TPA: hypothetical protein VFN64_07585 [Burkholderiaceae bacterium]|nr:hypothetical protein [Burkholderiaceae bacterium]
MRQVSFEEAAAVGGAACGDLMMSASITGLSVSGSLDTWSSCFNEVVNWVGDTYNSYYAYSATGIPYGEAHVG